MEILKEFDIKADKKELITFVGAGGKTSTMFTLAEVLKALGGSVLVTTTTAIMYPLKNQYDDIVITKEYSAFTFLETFPSSIVVFGSEVNSEGKLIGVDRNYIDDIYKRGTFDFILVEGDGSKRKPIKAPAGHEPVIPQKTTKVAGVIGIDALGKPVNEDYVHRPEIFSNLTGSGMNSIIDEEAICRLVVNEKGLFKGAPSHARKYLFINKVDEMRDNKYIEKIRENIDSRNFGLEKIIIGKWREVNKNV